jgi:hypothetical protein
MSKKTEVPDFSLLKGTVAPEILDAARAASKALKKAGIRHALIGGLAVGAYGYVRATKDVDFLVGDEAFVSHGIIVTFQPSVPIEVNGVKVDTLSTDDVLGDEEIDDPIMSDGVPIVTAEALVYLKLKAFRRRDQEDILQLLRGGLDERPIKKFLKAEAPGLLDRFDELVARVDDED